MHFRSHLARFALPVAMIATAADASPKPDASAEIRQLMDDYHAAILQHDGPRLAGLFVPEGAAWFDVLSDGGYARMQAKNPAVPKVRTNTVANFVGFVANSKARLDPQHGPVQIRTDGAIASVYFDFRFLVDGKVQNSGSESWQLVEFADGWRIASIVYSSNPV